VASALGIFVSTEHDVFLCSSMRPINGSSPEQVEEI